LWATRGKRGGDPLVSMREKEEIVREVGAREGRATLSNGRLQESEKEPTVI